jgi:hypothetical protein
MIETLFMAETDLAGHTRDGGSASKRFTWVDGAILALFALFAVGCFVGRWKGMNPFVYLGSDAGIVSSFVAAYQHPDLFRTDPLLGDFTNFRYYLAFHPILIYALNKITGDYGVAYTSLLLLTAFLQCAGFYLLGRVLFGSRYWAFLLSVMALCPIYLPIREFWGVFDDPLPRSLFHACLPYVLAAAIYYKDKRRVWPWLMVAVGLLFYTHPVSAPHWAFAIWLGIWPFLPKTWNWYRKIGYMFVLGLIFVATVLPWASNFLFVHGRAASVTVKYREVVEIIGERVGKELLDVGLALQMWWDKASSWPLWLYISWAICASVVVSFTRPERRKDIFLIAIWASGILFVAVGLTFIEQTICRLYDLKRLQMDSIRGIKYLVPLILVLSLWPLAEISRKMSSRSLNRTLVMLAGAILVGGWAWENPPMKFLDAARSWAAGSLMPPVSSTEKSGIEALNAVRRITPPGSKILPMVLPLEVRYCALRPVAYAYKDGGIFADTNLTELLEWERVRKEMESISNIKDNRAKLERLLILTRELGADYVLTDFAVDTAVAASLKADVLWSNKSLALVQPLPTRTQPHSR